MDMDLQDYKMNEAISFNKHYTSNTSPPQQTQQPSPTIPTQSTC